MPEIDNLKENFKKVKNRILEEEEEKEEENKNLENLNEIDKIKEEKKEDSDSEHDMGSSVFDE